MMTMKCLRCTHEMIYRNTQYTSTYGGPTLLRVSYKCRKCGYTCFGDGHCIEAAKENLHNKREAVLHVQH